MSVEASNIMENWVDKFPESEATAINRLYQEGAKLFKFGLTMIGGGYNKAVACCEIKDTQGEVHQFFAEERHDIPAIWHVTLIKP